MRKLFLATCLLTPSITLAALTGGNAPSAPWGGSVVVPTTASVAGPFNARDITAAYSLNGTTGTISGAGNVALTLGATGTTNRTGLSVAITGNGGTTKSVDLTTTPGGSAPSVYGVMSTIPAAAGTYSSYAIYGTAAATQSGNTVYGGNFSATSNSAGTLYGVYASASGSSGSNYGLYVNAGESVFNSSVTVNSGLTVINSSMSVLGYTQLATKTVALLQAITPTAVGQMYQCSNCTAFTFCVSTGTTRGAFSSPVAKTTACN